MDTDMFLTEDEIVALTGKLRPHAQVKALNFMGIEHRKRLDGSIVILRLHVEKVLGGAAKTVKPRTKDVFDFTNVR